MYINFWSVFFQFLHGQADSQTHIRKQTALKQCLFCQHCWHAGEKDVKAYHAV